MNFMREECGNEEVSNLPKDILDLADQVRYNFQPGIVEV